MSPLCKTRIFLKLYPQKGTNKLGTLGKLTELIKLAYVQEVDPGIYALTPKAVNFMKLNQRKIEFPLITGQGKGDSLTKAEALIDYLNQDYFFAALYPRFEHLGLIPDACLLFKKENTMQLLFLEVEEPKSDWQEYLHKKKEKYEKLATEDWIYQVWWKEKCQFFGFQYCQLEEFGFLVHCLGKFKENWEGWKFY